MYYIHSIFMSLQVRHYAVAAATQCSTAAVPELQVLSSNKVTVAAIDNNNPIAQVSIVFRYAHEYNKYIYKGDFYLT